MARFPGLQPRYERLVASQPALRPDRDRLPPTKPPRNVRCRQRCDGPALERLPPPRRPPQPVLFWLRPFPPRLAPESKPNDLDHYEGRYGIEDTRHAIGEARKQGSQAFCVTIDQRAGGYLPHLFGSNGYIVIRRPPGAAAAAAPAVDAADTLIRFTCRHYQERREGQKDRRNSLNGSSFRRMPESMPREASRTSMVTR